MEESCSASWDNHTKRVLAVPTFQPSGQLTGIFPALPSASLVHLAACFQGNPQEAQELATLLYMFFFF